MEYPDPVGSGLSVPVLGCQSDLCGSKIPLAGTMEDPGGKGNKDEDNVQSFPNIKRIICKSGLKNKVFSVLDRLSGHSLWISDR